jgi:8-amino-7-oxononanoate synthase
LRARMAVHTKAQVNPLRVPGNLIGVLRRHAEERPDQPIFVYSLEDQSEQAIMTYAQFDRRARAIAARLQDMGFTGQRVLLVYPPGLDFVTAFFGCLYAGCVAVPTYPPHRHRMVDRFHVITADAGARIALSTASAAAQFKSMIESESGQSSAFSQIPWLATDDIPDALAEQWNEPSIVPEMLAMLQYTSGSTSQPKGVMINHANLIDNIRAIDRAFGLHCEDISVFWLPMYHDMGLVGGVLVPMFAGVKTVLMSPATFLQKPFTWLAAISKYRASISGGPNFAYDLCIRKITSEQKAALDLSSWKLAFNGAEPVEAAILEQFTASFAQCGFNPAAIYPCYGLAEATLMVSGPKRGSGAVIKAFNEKALTENRVEPASDGIHQVRLVSCGSIVGTTRVIIVDSQTRTEAAPGRVGEIWIAGPSVGQGYWHKPSQTQNSFNAHLSDTDKGPFLRTGDLGFMCDGQLYIAGRREDLIIVRGLNRYPQDIEVTARRSHPLLEAGYGAAFDVGDNGSQRLVLVHEIRHNGRMDFTPVLNAVRTAVLDEHDLTLDNIVLVRCGTISRTSSGKIQRHVCRKAFLAGEIKALAEYTDSMAVKSVACSTSVNRDAAQASSSIPPRAVQYSQTGAFSAVCQHARIIANAPLPDLTPDMPLNVLGLDSLQRLELVASLEKTFGGHLPDTVFGQAQSLGDLANGVQKYLIDDSKVGATAGRIVPEYYDFTQFPEYTQLKRHESILLAVTGDNPYFRVDQGGDGSAAHIDGRKLINFCVYDYIGMAHDPEVIAAAKAATDRYGTSAGASRLVSGEKQVHRDLEQALAEFLGVPAAIAFVSGHATNVTTIGLLLGSEDLILHDTLAHNSIIQGAELSGATRRSFAHNDWMALDALLSESRYRYRRVLIAIEGVYSMDGDSPELPRFIELKKKHKTLMLIDEAHSLGTMGSTGRGIGEHWGVTRSDVDLWMGTLSKSLASCGGYIAGSAEMVEYLKYSAPGFVYSVGMPPSNAAAALAALKVLQRQPQRVARLHELAGLFLKLAKEHGLNTGSAGGTPVIPVIIGNSVKSLRLSHALFERGINVQPILYPAVPDHSALLRFFITTNHNETQIRTTVSAIAEELAKL